MKRCVSATRRVLATVLAAFVCGCATPLDPPTAPAVSPNILAALATPVGSESFPTGGAFSPTAAFYPLQLGNHWHYRKQLVVAVVPSEGEPSLYQQDGTIDRDLNCTEHRDGRDYVVEQAKDTDPFRTVHSWIRFRQDRTGLYEADVSIQEPPPCVPLFLAPSAQTRETSTDLARRTDPFIPVGPPEQRAAFRAAVERLSARLALVDAALRRMTVAPSRTSGLEISGPTELTRLRYPLQSGARWAIRADAGITFIASVEGADVLALPAGRLRGYRIRILSEFLGPNDVVRVWYGPAGFLQLAAHFETDAVDVFGQIQGLAITDQRETLESMSLVGSAVTWPAVGRNPLGR